MAKWHSALAAAALLASIPVLAAGPVSPRIFVAALSDDSRPAEDKARDGDRKPADLMAFAGVRSGSKIIELAPGGGYFTRLFSLSVGGKGHVYAFASRPSAAVEAWATTHPNVTMTVGQAGAVMAPVPVDIVWTSLNYHDFKNSVADGTDAAAKFNRAAFAALKPGGVYLVVDHEGAAGSGVSQTSTLHRIESAAVIREVEAAGFKLAGQSDILRHPADDHTQKVFEGAVRGKTDQFVLRFIKPAKR